MEVLGRRSKKFGNTESNPIFKSENTFFSMAEKKKKSMDIVIFVRLSILPLGIKNKREHKDKHDCVTVADRIFFCF